MLSQSQYDEQEAGQPPPQGERPGRAGPRYESQASYAEPLNDYSYRRGYAAQQYPSDEESGPPGPQESAVKGLAGQQLAPQLQPRSSEVPWWARPQERQQGRGYWLLALLIIAVLAFCASPFILTFIGLWMAMTALMVAALAVLPILLVLGAFGLLLSLFTRWGPLRYFFQQLPRWFR